MKSAGNACRAFYRDAYMHAVSRVIAVCVCGCLPIIQCVVTCFTTYLFPHLQRLRTLNLADADNLVTLLNILEPVDGHSTFTTLPCLIDFLFQMSQ